LDKTKKWPTITLSIVLTLCLGWIINPLGLFSFKYNGFYSAKVNNGDKSIVLTIELKFFNKADIYMDNKKVSTLLNMDSSITSTIYYTLNKDKISIYIKAKNNTGPEVLEKLFFTGILSDNHIIITFVDDENANFYLNTILIKE